MKAQPKSKVSGRSVDFSLIFKRLETQLIEGRQVEKISALLARDERWKKLDSQGQVQWARLAQLAGQADKALEILAAVNRSDPENRPAWQRRLELLAILGRCTELARVLAAAGDRVDRQSYLPLLEAGKERQEAPEAGLEPFLVLEKQRALRRRFAELFYGRQDCFARQWADRRSGKHGYVPVRRRMKLSDLDEHFQGKATYGIYLMLEDSTVKTAVIDADLKPALRSGRKDKKQRRRIWRERQYLFHRMEDLGRRLGGRPLVEFSGGKGYHFWFIFQRPVAAAAVRQVLLSAAGSLESDLGCFSLEVFPKQDSLDGGKLGNLVKLPLGVHRLSGKRSFFVHCSDRKLEAQLAFLETVQLLQPDALSRETGRRRQAKVVAYPGTDRWKAQYPELAGLEAACPPLAMVFAACRQGRGIGLREEKIILQTVGFLPRGRSLVHALMRGQPEYNPHLVDFKLSRLRGSPLGCRRIHSLLDYSGDFCLLESTAAYQHPLLHLGRSWPPKAEKIDNLQAALDNLDEALCRVRKFLK